MMFTGFINNYNTRREKLHFFFSSEDRMANNDHEAYFIFFSQKAISQFYFLYLLEKIIILM